MLRELQTYRAHAKEVNAVAWHPEHESLFATGGAEGAIYYHTADREDPLGSLVGAHDGYVWTLDWHPLGHLLASGAADCSVRFWTRHRPGDTLQDRYTLGRAAAEALGIVDGAAGGAGLGANDDRSDEEEEALPGLGGDVQADLRPRMDLGRGQGPPHMGGHWPPSLPHGPSRSGMGRMPPPPPPGTMMQGGLPPRPPANLSYPLPPPSLAGMMPPGTKLPIPPPPPGGMPMPPAYMPVDRRDDGRDRGRHPARDGRHGGGAGASGGRGDDGQEYRDRRRDDRDGLDREHDRSGGDRDGGGRRDYRHPPPPPPPSSTHRNRR